MFGRYILLYNQKYKERTDMTVQQVRCKRHNKSFMVMQTTTKAMNICHICNIEKLRKETV